eukprot:6735474-Prymnesium_polylepis.1
MNNCGTGPFRSAGQVVPARTSPIPHTSGSLVCNQNRAHRAWGGSYAAHGATPRSVSRGITSRARSD